ncbi:hypothetical protein KP79_PYT06950 [Mizuhopecten yessoensis]|uniref:Uncharacterized protein n=1 Tax=Mizuhopecten yessoensis TaxID=6573 RepID=A0A210QJU2_MIZYE|nr:hypothetical protein KP79_PYT06950 [Mizuhopecten yessoensis]
MKKRVQIGSQKYDFGQIPKKRRHAGPRASKGSRDRPTSDEALPEGRIEQLESPSLSEEEGPETNHYCVVKRKWYVKSTDQDACIWCCSCNSSGVQDFDSIPPTVTDNYEEGYRHAAQDFEYKAEKISEMAAKRCQQIPRFVQRYYSLDV